MTDPATLSTDAIERELHIAAAPETVFDFWVEPERLVRWMGRTATVEPRPGGRFRIDYNGSDIASGEVVELDRPNRLVLTWGWEAPGDATPPGASTVEVTFTPQGDGTLVRLRHSGLAAEAVEGHAAGWDQFLPGLATVAATA
jgi:uncharacterized protein YndB with AHSA1/START domain